jgi:hypothetical protein
VIDCVVFCSLFSKLYIAQAGKVLAGYSHPEHNVTLPSLDCLQPGDCIALESLVQHMFTENFYKAQIMPFCDFILASLLMYHEDFVSNYGRDHVVGRTFENTCQLYDILPANPSWLVDC